MANRKARKIVIGNWKMHKTRSEGRRFAQTLLSMAGEFQADVRLAVPFTLIQDVSALAAGSKISIGAQNISEHLEGAYTGEVSARMVLDAGAAFVLLGHSERRRLYGETSALVKRKVKMALSQQLQPVVCIGESLEEYDAGITKKVVKEQLEESLKDLEEQEIEQIIIAYEPVWAIGTNRSATPAIADQVHTCCREIIANRWGGERAERLPILYGGSVKPENSAELLGKENIDGLLVGGASLTVESFSLIAGYRS